VSEAFNSVSKVEFVHRQPFTTRAKARTRIATWIADFYDTRRRHNSAGGLAPIEFERIMEDRRNCGDHHAAVAARRQSLCSKGLDKPVGTTTATTGHWPGARPGDTSVKQRPALPG
jgi:hypothetical protein